MSVVSIVSIPSERGISTLAPNSLIGEILTLLTLGVIQRALDAVTTAYLVAVVMIPPPQEKP